MLIKWYVQVAIMCIKTAHMVALRRVMHCVTPAIIYVIISKQNGSENLGGGGGWHFNFYIFFYIHFNIESNALERE